MAKSIEEAAKENNEWQQTVKKADKKAARMLGFNPDGSPAQPEPSFDEQLKDFTNTHIQNIRNYAAELVKKSNEKDSTATSPVADETRQKMLKSRASYLRMAADMLWDNPKKIFTADHAEPLLSALESANKDGAAYHVEAYAARINVAAQELNKLNQNYNKSQGPII